MATKTGLVRKHLAYIVDELLELDPTSTIQVHMIRTTTQEGTRLVPLVTVVDAAASAPEVERTIHQLIHEACRLYGKPADGSYQLAVESAPELDV